MTQTKKTESVATATIAPAYRNWTWTTPENMSGASTFPLWRTANLPWHALTDTELLLAVASSVVHSAIYPWLTARNLRGLTCLLASLQTIKIAGWYFRPKLSKFRQKQINCVQNQTKHVFFSFLSSLDFGNPLPPVWSRRKWGVDSFFLECAAVSSYVLCGTRTYVIARSTPHSIGAVCIKFQQ